MTDQQIQAELIVTRDTVLLTSSIFSAFRS
jgi:hypothetical protein